MEARLLEGSMCLLQYWPTTVLGVGVFDTRLFKAYMCLYTVLGVGAWRFGC